MSRAIHVPALFLAICNVKCEFETATILHSPRRSKTSQFLPLHWHPVVTWHWCNPVVLRRARRWSSSILGRPSDYIRLIALDSRFRTCLYWSITSTVQIFTLQVCHEIVISSIWPISSLLATRFFHSAKHCSFRNSFDFCLLQVILMKQLQEHKEFHRIPYLLFRDSLGTPGIIKRLDWNMFKITKNTRMSHHF